MKRRATTKGLFHIAAANHTHCSPSESQYIHKKGFLARYSNKIKGKNVSQGDVDHSAENAGEKEIWSFPLFNYGYGLVRFSNKKRKLLCCQRLASRNIIQVTPFFVNALYIHLHDEAYQKIQIQCCVVTFNQFLHYFSI